MERWKIDIAIFLILIVLSIFLVFVYIEIKDEKTECIVNPLQYGIKEYSEQANSELTCTCGFFNNKYSRFIATKNGTFPIT
jgi:nucleoside recognition membrane protein YjiH